MVLAAPTNCVRIQTPVDEIEIYAAHEYLLHQFLNPITNRRMDDYDGSFERRTRLLMEILQVFRSVIPDTMPLFLRVSGTEWMEETELGKGFGSWNVECTTRLARPLP